MKQTIEQLEAALSALQELANTQIQISLRDWNRICNAIRFPLEQSLAAARSQVTADQAREALDDLEPMRSYCPDHYDENEQCQLEAAFFVRDYFETIRQLLKERAGV